MYPEYVLETLRKRWGLEMDDTSKDGYFNLLSPKRVFDEVCEWNGLIHFGPCIRGWIEAIYAIDLDRCAEAAAKKMDGTNVCVSWRDELGVVYVEIDGYGISFLEGYAIFSDLDDKQYKIPGENLIEVAFI